MSVASMPMYDLPELHQAHDALWATLARNLRREGVSDVPDTLVHDRPLGELWSDPKLLFSQCCGYDLVNRYAGKLQPIAVPHYDAPGCKGADYASVVVVAADSKATDVLQMHGAVCVINGPESHSGMGALRALIAPVSDGGHFFSEVKVSGSHAASLEMVRRGEADVAAIDCVTYALIARHRPAAVTGTRTLGRTYQAPAVPYVARANVDHETVARMRTAVFRTFADSNLAAVRRALLLKAIEDVPLLAYGRIAESWDAAAAHGYPELR